MSISGLGVSLWNWNALRPSHGTNEEPVSPAEAVPEVRRGRGALPEDAVGRMPPVQAKEQSPEGQRTPGEWEPEGECQTCKNRTYQDGSDDPGVSFKTPTKISPEKAASMVRAHEMEHVVRNQQEAMRENRKVVSQSVTYHNAICPECGRTYVSGGTTRTVTRDGDMSSLFQAGIAQENEEKGQRLSLTA